MSGGGIAVLAALGATVGSFTGTAAIRAGRHEQVLHGRSHCDACQAPLGMLESLPIVSFLSLRGRCRRCAARIPAGHLMAECAGLVVAVSALTVAPLTHAALLIPLGICLIALACVDLQRFILPNLLVLAVGVIAALLALERSVSHALAGGLAALLAFAFLEAVRRAFLAFRGEAGLGQGDVKLIAALAIWLGPYTPWMLALASMAALGVQLVRRGKAKRIAFGPYLAASAWIVGLALEGGLWPVLA